MQACLCLVEQRETRYRVHYYYRLFEQTMRGLNRDPRNGAMPTAESIHGSLLGLGELLRYTGEFMLARFKEVTETVLKFKDSKVILIRNAVIALLPRLASFAPERFAQDYLSKCIAHLLNVLKHTSERGAAFLALADMAAACRPQTALKALSSAYQPWRSKSGKESARKVRKTLSGQLMSGRRRKFRQKAGCVWKQKG